MTLPEIEAELRKTSERNERLASDIARLKQDISELRRQLGVSREPTAAPTGI